MFRGARFGRDKQPLELLFLPHFDLQFAREVMGELDLLPRDVVAFPAKHSIATVGGHPQEQGRAPCRGPGRNCRQRRPSSCRPSRGQIGGSLGTGRRRRWRCENSYRCTLGIISPSKPTALAVAGKAAWSGTEILRDRPGSCGTSASGSPRRVGGAFLLYPVILVLIFQTIFVRRRDVVVLATLRPGYRQGWEAGGPRPGWNSGRWGRDRRDRARGVAWVG